MEWGMSSFLYLLQHRLCLYVTMTFFRQNCYIPAHESYAGTTGCTRFVGGILARFGEEHANSWFASRYIGIENTPKNFMNSNCRWRIAFLLWFNNFSSVSLVLYNNVSMWLCRPCHTSGSWKRFSWRFVLSKYHSGIAMPVKIPPPIILLQRFLSCYCTLLLIKRRKSILFTLLLVSSAKKKQEAEKRALIKKPKQRLEGHFHHHPIHFALRLFVVFGFLFDLHHS